MNRSSQAETWSWLVLLAGSLVFVWAKWADLALPLFWDEIGVYGPGVLAMMDEGIGLMPSALEPELSRGHPLLFYFLYAVWGKIFVFSMHSMHLPGLMMTLGAAWSLWWMGRKEFGPWPGVIAGLTFLAMPAVFAQAGLILPEMMLSLWLIWGLYHLSRKQWGWYALFSSLAILTKESAIILPMAGLVFFLLPPHRFSVRSLLLTFIPIGVFGLFLLMQRLQNGWFFFPYHTELISFNWNDIRYKAGMMLDFLFVYQGRWLLSGALLLGGSLFLANRKTVRLSAIHPWIRLAGIFLLGFMCFTVLNAYMDRYQLVLLALLAMGLGATFKEATQLASPMKHTGWLALLVPAGMLAWQGGEAFRYDVDISYRNILKVQADACDFLMEQVPAEAEVYANFPLYSCFQDPRFGFIGGEAPFSLTVRPNDPATWIANFHPGVPWAGEPLDSLELVRLFQEGEVSCGVYLRE